MPQLCRELPLIGIQGGPHLVSCSESSIIKLSSVISSFKYVRLHRDELVPFPVQSRVESKKIKLEIKVDSSARSINKKNFEKFKVLT